MISIHNKATLQKYAATFVTVDGKEHDTGNRYNWCDVDKKQKPVEEYIMEDIKQDGYLCGTDDTMYILNNIVSIRWYIADELIIKGMGNDKKVWYTDDDIQEIPIKYIETTDKSSAEWKCRKYVE